MKTISTELLLAMVNTFIDYHIDCNGIRETIAYLIRDFDLSIIQLKEFGFDEDDIKYVMENLNDY